jgi:hypothetical protein
MAREHPEIEMQPEQQAMKYQRNADGQPQAIRLAALQQACGSCAFSLRSSSSSASATALPSPSKLRKRQVSFRRQQIDAFDAQSDALPRLQIGGKEGHALQQRQLIELDQIARGARWRRSFRLRAAATSAGTSNVPCCAGIRRRRRRSARNRASRRTASDFAAKGGVSPFRQAINCHWLTRST